MKTKTNLEFVWNQLSKAITAYNYNYELPDKDLVIEAINNSNIDLVKELISTFKLLK